MRAVRERDRLTARGVNGEELRQLAVVPVQVVIAIGPD
jgi:hypothetical protein